MTRYRARRGIMSLRVLLGVCATILVPLAVASGRLPAVETSHIRGAYYDCGAKSLSILLRLEGRPTDLSRLEDGLPAPTPRGYSMRELREAARACGLRLLGVRLPRGDRAPDRPAIVFLKRGPHGHYVVIRPVGHTGKLVQVLDPNREPEVMDASRLYASPEWTGLALVPRRPNWPLRVAGAVLVVSTLVVAGSWLVPRLRRRGVAA